VERDNIVVDGSDCGLQGTGIGTGINLMGRTNVTVKNIEISDFFYGIYLNSSLNNSLSSNNVRGNFYGIYLSASSNNTIIGNNITKNAANGIYLYYSQNNTFFHNNFISNTNQVYDVGAPSNIWDSGVEGNQWSNYENRYPNSTELDSSGIWNTPYVLDGNNQDNYPLVNVIPEFPSWIILPLFIVATLLIIFYKQRLPKTPSNL
jgi:parallel beta-helix repeat protein